MPSSAELQIVFEGKDKTSNVIRGIKGELNTLNKIVKVTAGLFAAQTGFALFDKVTAGLGELRTEASGLEQSIGAVNSIFKDNAATILDWSKGAAEAAGLSERAFNQLAAPLGAMLKTQGFQDFTGLTIELTKRGADLAATFGGSVNDAMIAVQAAIRGELDPIERYGVSLKAVTVEARALADTGKTVAASLTEQEKSAARLALLFEQTSDAAGQFGRELETDAGRAAVAAAKMDNLQSVLGQKLLPITIKITEAKIALINLFTTKLIPALEALYQEHWPAIARAIETVRPVLEFFVNDITAKIGGILGVFQSIVNGFQSFIGVFKSLIQGDWAGAWENLKGVAESGAKVAVNAIVAAFGSLPNIMIGIMEDVLNIVIDGWNKVAGVFSGEVNVLGKNINPLAGQDLSQGRATLPRLPQMGPVFDNITNAMNSLATTTATVDQGMVDLSVNTGAASSAMRSIADRLSEAMSAIFGRGTQEETALALKIAEAEKRLMKAGPNEAQRAIIEKEIQTLRDRQSLMEKDNQIQKLKIDLADRTLLTEREQNAMTAILIKQTQTLTGQMEFAATAAGRFAQALGVVVGNMGPQYEWQGDMPFARRDLEAQMAGI